jgi:HEPN domain-containing protein
MPPSNPARDSARDWLARAQGKLALARSPLPPGGYWEDLCFFAQQGAELAIKAVYQHHGWPFARSHDLGALVDGLKLQGLTVPPDVEDADQLNPYAVQTRYPGIAIPVSQAEYDEALRIAAAVAAWAETMVP